MRLKPAKLIIAFTVLGNLLIFYYSWRAIQKRNLFNVLPLADSAAKQSLVTVDPVKLSQEKQKNANKHLRKSITIIFRSFYNFENDLKASINNILEIVPNIQILVIQDNILYPPIVYERNETNKNVRFMSLGFDIRKNARDLFPLMTINTKFALFMPDSVRLSGKSLMQKILKEVNGLTGKKGTAGIQNSAKRIVIVPFAGNIKSFSSCCEIILDLANWTIEYRATNDTLKCDLYLQKHAFIADVSLLRDMPDALGAPFPEQFYIQAKISGVKKTILTNTFQDGKRLFTSYHTRQRRMEIRRKQFKEMYKKFQIKKIIRRSHKVSAKSNDVTKDAIPQHNLVLDTQFSSSNFSLPLTIETELIGCERTTKSCVGTIYQRKPFYIYLQKHTPPCCVEKLQKVFEHILEEFENVGIRYWLDNIALKSAAESNQLDRNAYEIDLSFNVDDLERCVALKKSQTRPFIDTEGFYWIKATDGQYFRVQYSKTNQIGVNLLPFEIQGNAVKPNGFFGWKAREFSLEFLHPMSTVLLLGKNVMCPNNVREFLEFKGIK